MGKVQLLSDNLINKIAAGEVVERPSSIVKELIENSLDAGATKIDIDIKRGGKEMIRISDNGCGMTQEDALMALQRHATSKIHDENDLFHIMTMGFRGEAIPSIASVSRFTLDTRTAESTAGVRIVVEGGNEPKVNAVGRAVGTTLEITDLFYNIPARKKFLKTDSTEFSHITETVTRLSMSNSAVRFKLTHNGRSQLNAPVTHDMKERVASLLGQQIGESMYPFEFSTGWLQLKGIFSRPDVTTRGMRGIYLFVNGRFFRHHGFAHACHEAYRGTIEKGRYPYIVLFMELAPSLIDVNVHPQKIEVRFQREQDIYGRILSALRNALARTPWVESSHSFIEKTPNQSNHPQQPISSENLTPPQTPSHHNKLQNKKTNNNLSQKKIAPPSQNNQISKQTDITHKDLTNTDLTNNFDNKDSASKEIAAPKDFREFKERFWREAQAQNLAVEPESNHSNFLSPLPNSQNNLPFLNGWDSSKTSELEDTTAQNHSNNKEELSSSNNISNDRDRFFSSMRYIGQFALMYLILEQKETLIFLDQHAAHERISYQHLLEEYTHSSIKQQRFLIPPRLELSLVEAQRAEQYSQELEKLGLELEPFGGQSFVLKAVPQILQKGNMSQLITDLLDELSHGKQTASLDQRRDEVLMRMACHGSIRGPHKLTSDEVYSLLDQLDNIDFRASCPHGRPIYFELPKVDMEKRFHRT